MRKPKRKKVYYPYRSGHGMIGSGSTADVSANTNAPPEQEIASINLVGVEMNTAGDMVSMLTPVPWDLNPTHEIGVRPVFQTASATAADTIEWIVLYDILTNGGAMADATTALNTTVGTNTVTGVAQALEVGSEFRGVIDADVVTSAQIANWAFFVWKIEMQAKAAGLTEDIIFLGLGLDYMPQDWLGGFHSHDVSYDTMDA